MTKQRMLPRFDPGSGVRAVRAAATVLAQDQLSKAKGFYASADYEEALTLLETLKGNAASTEAAAYQVFCLVALGRRDEARVAIEAIVARRSAVPAIAGRRVAAHPGVLRRRPQAAPAGRHAPGVRQGQGRLRSEGLEAGPGGVRSGDGTPDR